jgi:hypothetical protein
VRLENGADRAGICPRLNIIIQIIHPSSFLETEKLLQHKAFLRVRTVRSRKTVMLLKIAKTLHVLGQSLSCVKQGGEIERKESQSPALKE